jgi:hypothetical protein
MSPNLRLYRSKHTLDEGVLYTAYSYKIPSPVGTVFVFVTEVDGEPKFVQLYIGKSGSEVNANAYALQSLSNELLKEFNGFNRLMLHLCDISTDKVSLNIVTNKKVRSLPEALYVALSMYREKRYPTVSKRRLPSINHDRQRRRNQRVEV